MVLHCESRLSYHLIPYSIILPQLPPFQHLLIYVVFIYLLQGRLIRYKPCEQFHVDKGHIGAIAFPNVSERRERLVSLDSSSKTVVS